jgi:hypothetical protein
VVCICALAACFFVAPRSYGDFVNPSFELYDPNGGPYFDTAVGWEVDEYSSGLHTYAADVNSLLPKIEYTEDGHGDLSGWPAEIVANGLAPIDGDRLLMLSTGHIGAPGTTDHATAWQHISAQEGDRIHGYYFFGTADYLATYNDFATITLVDTSADPNDIELILINVSYVGSNGSLDGWEPFEYVFDSRTAGEYDLTFYVTDQPDRDNFVNSYLGIDDLLHCPAPISYGDLNNDCKVNNSDFSVISNNWLIDCEYPEVSDPNYCPIWTNELGSPGDIDGDDKVDITDIRLMSSYWLLSD